MKNASLIATALVATAAISYVVFRFALALA
ncbi:hypothetical protein C8J35_1027 [Rhizobium sp. PP-F2F-G38]|nr:hypothetical protein C8J32_101263 [Rhizobium sp. PP-CC-3A-592]PYE35628.1 hypothetical protein C8J37_1028 [Rhizobium sp. PP-WC-1G-195]PYE45871.1 hypothetical protein DFI02_1017 [Rhizobium sp. PP-F2F-G20b]PYE99122.1 hypothetical protein C8J35_1027 [Rhizobium sp. PP-F2F-G38]TCL96965.1 hypothetical protein C8J38_1011332 [Rhizobium sp. PP-WC-2G-219]TCP87155.1 hypothetical protein C8J31_10514 [Rhizobium sp. PP-CC-2G-626]TCQ12701.1 hypothetical protein C8J34_1011346 [Rhizobium sp. PP-F2F-G36]TCQ